MNFYWQGYAELLHLATTAKTLPPVVTAPGAPLVPPPPGILRRLWRFGARSIAGRLSRQASSAAELLPRHESTLSGPAR